MRVIVGARETEVGVLVLIDSLKQQLMAAIRFMSDVTALAGER